MFYKYAEVDLGGSGGWGSVCNFRVSDTCRWIHRHVVAFLEEARSASGFRLELSLSKRVVRTKSWG